jgi:hypothetical protein
MVQETAKLKISHPKIKRVVCLAPMWNETTWLKASALVVVKGSGFFNTMQLCYLSVGKIHNAHLQLQFSQFNI